MSVSVNPPKTPVTKGSNGIATATIPNVCKMPGPPAPFVPAPLPNIGMSGLSPKDYSTSVKIEGNEVAIKGSTFESIGDIASKGTGGGLISANTHGITKFVGPGSMDVKIEGKNVQYLSDPMLNNCAAGGSPPNAATLMGVIQMSGLLVAVPAEPCPVCARDHGALEETTASKASAQDLAGRWRAQRGESTMLGVMHCRTCDIKYADRSGTTDWRLCRAAHGPYRHQNPTTIQQAAQAQGDARRQITEQPFRDRLGAQFDALWQQGRLLNQQFLLDTTNNDAAYAPGNCAGQKVVVLLLSDGVGGIPGAMTEQWYSTPTEPSGRGRAWTRSRMAYLSQRRAGGLDAQNPLRRRFKHGETVPPCRTCELLLPHLLCFQGRTACSHGPAPAAPPAVR